MVFSSLPTAQISQQNHNLQLCWPTTLAGQNGLKPQISLLCSFVSQPFLETWLFRKQTYWSLEFQLLHNELLHLASLSIQRGIAKNIQVRKPIPW